jgi:general secretion pathway protein K
MRRRAARGFVLAGVLWALALMSLLVTQIASAARTERSIAANLRGAAVAEAAADGAVAETILALLDGTRDPGGPSRTLRIGAADVAVRVTDEAGRINPNDPTHPVAPALRALLIDAGLEPQAARALADAIVDWRTATPNASGGGTKRAQYRAAGLDYAPSDRPFESLDEIRAVIGMTPEVFARIAPALSLYAEPVLPGIPPGRYPDANLVVDIAATATAPTGARFTRRATVRLLGNAHGRGAPYQVLTWETSGP